MSKVDAQRAMKLARYEQMQALASAQRKGAPAQVPAPTVSSPAAPAKAAARRGVPSAAPTSEVEPAAVTGTDGICGHRSIGNKSCQRPAGHPEKNHRYK